MTHIELRGERELQAFNILKDQTFGHTRVFDEDLLEKTGMHTEFASVWKAVGWSVFSEIFEKGSRDLTIQFLCTLVETKNGVSFRFFGNEFIMSWWDLSTVLGFHHKCTTDVEQVTHDYHKESFGHSISGINTYSQPRCNDIQHPTLRLMDKWLALTCFPREDVRTVPIDELRILYAMVN